MTVNQAFKNATNYLKRSGKVKKYNIIADQLGIDQKLLAKYRFGSIKMHAEDKLVKDFIEIYPEISNFFDPDSTETEKPTHSKYTSLSEPEKTNALLRELVDDKRKIIAQLEAEVRQKENEIAALEKRLKTAQENVPGEKLQ